MGTAERRAREKDALRQKILQVATELFLHDGFDSVTMRAIADRIEYAPSTIYLYFKNKTEIVDAICVETFEILIDRLHQIEQQALPPDASLAAGIRCYIEFGIEYPHQYRLVFGNVPSDDFTESAESNLLGRQALEHLVRIIAIGQQAGLFPTTTDPAADALTVWSHMHGTTCILINDHGRYNFPWPSKESMIERSVDLITKALLSPAA
ncbi:MAG: TetR/AcrR family transcriptional regulator [Acidobacteriota bacterium]|jgi:AcrR family transcriptional regulator|nr:TetR/AcrR family transcriptional regulator [Bryobacteraceae bacterium CoA2 C42]MCA2963717.1 TetR/AcrR family transcriptional regulator [Acidobacteriaceae bacterium]